MSDKFFSLGHGGAPRLDAGYRRVGRIECEDDEGSVLAFITETNDVAWKTYASHEPAGMEPRVGLWAWCPTAELAAKAIQEHVDNALAMGWRLRQPPVTDTSTEG